LVYKRRCDTIEKFCIFAIRVIIATMTSRSSENKNFEKKTNLATYYILAILLPSFINIFPVVAEIGLAVPKSIQIHAMLKLVVFLRFPKNFPLQPPSNFPGKQFLKCFTSVENFVNFGS